MAVNLDTSFDEKYVEGRLPLAEDKKTPNLHQHILQKRRKLSGQRCQCCACGEYFNKVVTFDLHRVGKFDKDRRCLTVQEMRDRNMTKTQDDYWLAPITEKAKEYFKKRRAN